MSAKVVAKATFLAQAEAMYDALSEWRAAHGEASFDKIAEQVQVKQQVQLGELLGELAVVAEAGRWLADQATNA